ncbi:Aste57867_23003 [Aphanomyces stellatus]|uniref:Aste57867_23003 protein n=1 Tax=Aphanomyces stellatus TaxID=120398 RepID=A0A485LM99_9STRA|nr:hypothetical protein As57867_022932 [Aphanomyces stellatus]VFT99652.1 Aste57867_23003 [Aphanomyces stellatus]
MTAIKVVAACNAEGLRITTAELMKSHVLWRSASVVSTSSVDVWPFISLSEDVLDSIQAEWALRLNLNSYIAYPVTPLQAGMVYATVNNREKYAMQVPLILESTFDTEMLSVAFQSVVEYHDTLRTTFVTSTSGIYQIIRNDTLGFAVERTSAPSIESFLALDLARGFEIGDLYFVRMTFVLVGDERYAVLTIHHALYDGWTLSMLTSDILDVLEGRPLTPRPSFRGVVDYIEAQDISTTEGYWRSYLSGFVPCPIVSTGHIEETTRPYQPLELEAQVSLAEIKAAAQRVGVTPAEFSKVAWAITLQKYTRQNDVVFGEVVANRDIPVKDADSILGPLINTVPCRVKFDETLPIQSIFDDIEANRASTKTHSYTGLTNIKRWSGVEGDLFETLFVYQQLPDIPQIQQGRGLQVYDVPATPFSNEYLFELIMVPTESSMHAHALFNPKDISASLARWMLVEFDHALFQLCNVAKQQDTSMRLLFELCPTQTQFIESVSFGPCSPLPYELLHHAFEERAKQHPQVRAIEFEGVGLTDVEIQGVGVGSRVAVIMDRCLEFPLGLLATLKAGAVMVPLALSLPIDRLKWMLEDANCHVVITKNLYNIPESLRLSLKFKYLAVDIENISLSYIEFCPFKSSKKMEAYVVFTSGSTGKPKGVPVLHTSALNTIWQTGSKIGFHPGARALQFFSISFDGFQGDMWQCLTHGATLILWGETYVNAIKTVDIITCTPSALLLLGHPGQYPALKYVHVAGETCPVSLKQRWSPFVRLFNLYGPSECAIMSHFTELSLQSQINIGKSIVNTNSYILDKNNNWTPIGVVGELYLSGLCVSPGYINLPNQTAERFLPDPFVGGDQMMFRTGDLGRLLPNGKFEVLGRKDNQIKLKGYRIELDEVAGAMLQHPQVVTAAAIVKDKTHLVGYFTPANVNTEELIDVVASHLPVYMVPAVWVGLDVMPQNANGKIDKKALEAMDIVVETNDLKSDAEKRIGVLWSNILKIDISQIGRNASFFSIGGDSLTAVRLLKLLQQEFKSNSITLDSVWTSRRLRDLATIVTQLTSGVLPVQQFPSLFKSTKVASFKILCFHAWGSSAAHMKFQLSSIMDYLGDDFEWEFLQAPHKVDDKDLQRLERYYEGMEGHTWLGDGNSLSDTMSLVKTKATSMGRVDGIVGFCLGANIVRCLDMSVAEGEVEKSWKVSVLASPSSFDKAHPGEAIPSLCGPCIHLFSAEDTTRQSHIYSELVEIQHTSGHDIPRDKETAAQIGTAILSAMKQRNLTDK